jgi:hypothetical protein
MSDARQNRPPDCRAAMAGPVNAVAVAPAGSAARYQSRATRWGKAAINSCPTKGRLSTRVGSRRSRPGGLLAPARRLRQHQPPHELGPVRCQLDGDVAPDARKASTALVSSRPSSSCSVTRSYSGRVKPNPRAGRENPKPRHLPDHHPVLRGEQVDERVVVLHDVRGVAREHHHRAHAVVADVPHPHRPGGRRDEPDAGPGERAPGGTAAPRPARRLSKATAAGRRPPRPAAVSRCHALVSLTWSPSSIRRP